MKTKRGRRLEIIYAQIPDVECKGLCAESCSIIGMTELERDRMATAGGGRKTVNEKGECGYLENGRCSVYSVRPLVCRLFGTVEDLPCPFGCEPKLSALSGSRLFQKVEEIGGGQVFNVTAEQVEKLLK